MKGRSKASCIECSQVVVAQQSIIANFDSLPTLIKNFTFAEVEWQLI